MKQQNCFVKVDVKDELPPAQDEGFKESIDVFAGTTENRFGHFGYFNIRTKAFYCYAQHSFVDVTYWLKEIDLNELKQKIASEAWEAADNFAHEQEKYPYGKRGGIYEFPNKETYLQQLNH